MEARMDSPPTEGSFEYDVVVMGGALSGAATATLLLRQNPGIRILILEKSAKLSRRVGSGCNSRPQARLVEIQHRTSNRSRVVEVERRQGLGQSRAGRQVSLVVARCLRDTEHCHQPCDRRRLVELVDSAKRR